MELIPDRPSSQLVIATRKSPLALQQAHWVQARLKQAFPEMDIQLQTFVTQGDKFLDQPLQNLGGKGLFTKELEHALLMQTADLAVHSAKDVPFVLPPGLSIGAICQREDPRDAFVLPAHASKVQRLDQEGPWSFLPSHARVGTVSLRRQMQIKLYRPDLEILPVRGNLTRRLERLDSGEFEAIMLAVAGLNRMGWSHRISASVLPDVMIPAAGQGALALECREGDQRVLTCLKALHDAPTAEAVWAERSFCRHLGGSCLLPIAAFGERVDHTFTLSACLGLPNGSESLKHVFRHVAPECLSQAESEWVGQQLAKYFLEQGAERILQACQS